MHRWDPAGLPLHRAGSFNDTNHFHDLFNGSGPTPISCGNMDSYKDVFYAAGLPALILTGITLVYLLLKAYQFTVYAVSHQTERRLAAAMPGGRQQEHSSIEGEEGDPQVHEQVPRSFSNQYGAGIQQPSRSVSLSGRRKDICIAARRNVEEYSGESVVRENGKRLQSQGNRSTENNNGQRPSGAHDDTTRVFADLQSADF